MEAKNRDNKLRMWLLGNSVASAILTAATVGLVCSQIWLHVNMDDQDPGSTPAATTAIPNTTAQQTTEAPATTAPVVTTEYVPSESEKLLGTLFEELEYIKYEAFGCNNCTHEPATDSSGKTKCMDKTYVDIIAVCSCYCGYGINQLQKECVWYEETLDDCREVRSRDPNYHKCGDVTFEPENTLESCITQKCVVDKLTQKTLNVKYAESNSDFFYTGVTKLGQKCDLGFLDLPGVVDRMRGETNVYELNMECDACMVTADEVFNRVDVMIRGTNGWDVEFIEVEVNGGKIGRYATRESVDDHLTVPFTLVASD